MRQAARLGLPKAARRYREPLGHGAVPYALPTITGEPKRCPRDQFWAVRPPRALRELRLRINAIRPRLVRELGHGPSTAGPSTAAGVPATDVGDSQIADMAMAGQRVGHGDVSDDPEEHRVMVVLGGEDPGYDLVEDLGLALSDASPAAGRLLRLRFVEEMAQGEIAEESGVRLVQVSRLLRRLPERRRCRMAVLAGRHAVLRGGHNGVAMEKGREPWNGMTMGCLSDREARTWRERQCAS